jgi:uroporphyrinogen-III synthase
LADVAQDLGRDVPAVISPLLRIVPVGVAPDMAGAAAVIFTSQAGVEAFAALGGVASGAAWCVGDRTAQAARAEGFTVAGVAETAEALVAAVSGAGPLVHLHGKHTRGDVAERLRTRGVSVVAACVYDQVAQALSPQAEALLRAPGPVCVPLFSPRTAQLFHQALPSPLHATLFLCAMSPAVAEAAAGIPAEVLQIASAPTGSAMLKEVAKRLNAPHVA